MTQNNGQNTGQNNTSYTPLLNCGYRMFNDDFVVGIDDYVCA